MTGLEIVAATCLHKANNEAVALAALNTFLRHL